MCSRIQWLSQLFDPLESLLLSTATSVVSCKSISSNAFILRICFSTITDYTRVVNCGMMMKGVTESIASTRLTFALVRPNLWLPPKWCSTTHRRQCLRFGGDIWIRQTPRRINSSNLHSKHLSTPGSLTASANSRTPFALQQPLNQTEIRLCKVVHRRFLSESLQ